MVENTVATGATYTVPGPGGALFEPVIGLEVHVELNTKSKIFCSCAAAFGAEPNSQVCPVCMGLPGSLPVLNRAVVEYAMKAALALNCRIQPFSQFHRKNYFYPDLPKAYQVSQYDYPLATGGFIEIDVNGSKKRIGIKRLHLEEDAGKLLHEGAIDQASFSLVDFNRCGVPLIEIVSEPDVSSPEEARSYLQALKSILQYTGVSDCKMEEGSLRVDANVSVRPAGSATFGTRTELKNVGSFRSVVRGLEYEIKRQVEVVSSGGEVVQETRHWDEPRGITVSLRGKEEAHDYRYFPEPDLVPLSVDDAWVEQIRGTLPELPEARKRRFVESYGLPEYDASVLTVSPRMADFFEDCVRAYGTDAGKPKTVSNWVMGEVTRFLNVNDIEIEQAKVTPAHISGLLKLIDDGTISGKIAKSIFDEMCETGETPGDLVKRKGLVQISDEGELERLVLKAIEDNPKVAQDFKSGKSAALGFLVGQVMKATRGRASPEAVNRLLKQHLG
ncbi:MAG: Asp-tRNA(Asn)/Glu-tRNA(Gln) amidotransferase subunit GatB [Firmicutes bacterium]|nr:Asp-tRNA(Asn)/Glu-tRNA(Gln) amidotransferase subunit GatB [Bacillota bacterium]